MAGKNKKKSLNAEMAMAIIEHSFEAVVITKSARSDNTIIYVNPAWEKISGWSSEEVVGKCSPRILKSGKTDPQFYQNMWDTISRGDLFRGEITNKRKDGSFYTAEINIFPVKLTGNGTVCIDISRDITEKKSLEQELSDYTRNLETLIKKRTEEVTKKAMESENVVQAMMNLTEDLDIEKTKAERESIKFQTLLTSVGQGLIVVDNDFKITFINPEAENLLDLSEKDIGKSYFEVWDIENETERILTPEERPVAEAIKTKKRIVTSKYSYVRKSDGKKFAALITATPIVFDEKISGAIEIFRDITEEKRIERAKTEFVSLASHQLRTPLTTIKWYSEMLSENTANLSSAQKKYLDEINSGTNRMAALISAILNVSQIELGTFAMEKKPVNVPETIDRAIDLYFFKINSKQLTVIKDYEKEMPLIFTDANVIKIVADNLISNAIDYTPDKGKITIQIKKENGNLNIKVADNGYGIPKDEQSKIFTRFYRASNVKKEVTQGTGLGLYIVKSILEHMGGEIRFESEGENKGTTFYVRIPV
ncbi:PAS domain S-box protein [Candidatus Wolfebacteria bacterium]|nr:PAS domain S-box protein [Candidatus Wolfebacteria bacterium]